MKENGQEKREEAIRKIPNELKQYMEKRIELLFLDIGEEISKFVARSFYKSLGMLIILIAFILALFSLAVFLGEVLHNVSLGYLLTSVPVFIIGILLFILRPRKLVHKLRDQIFEMVLQSYNKMTDKEKPEELKSKN